MQMRKLLFLTTYASPYRVHFFDELSRTCDVTVLFAERIEEKKHRDASWFVQGSGATHFVQLQKRILRLRGKELCMDVVEWLKKPYDAIVVCGYSSPTFMLAMAYMRAHKIPFWMEVDGGLVRQDRKPVYLFKKKLVSMPSGWLSTGKATSAYLTHYGAQPDKIHIYPFSSLWERDILQSVPTVEEKQELRQQLGITEEKVVLTVGQFIHRKGFDVLLKAIPKVKGNTGIYFVGGQPTEEYLSLARAAGDAHIHFVGFKNKEELAKYYQASDVYVMPTREDIWGLVINEAMANGLPVVSTDRCVAAVELIEEDVNGYVVPVEDADALAEKLNAVLEGDRAAMGRESLKKIRPYTLENMARVHAELFGAQE